MGIFLGEWKRAYVDGPYDPVHLVLRHRAACRDARNEERLREFRVKWRLGFTIDKVAVVMNKNHPDSKRRTVMCAGVMVQPDPVVSDGTWVAFPFHKPKE